MAHLGAFPDVPGPELAATSISFVKKLEESHPTLQAVFTGIGVNFLLALFPLADTWPHIVDGSPSFLWYQALKFAAKDAPKVGSHLNLANVEGWINRKFRSKFAVSPILWN